MATVGRAGAISYAGIVCLSCLGALNATVFSMGRLTQCAGARQYIPAFFDAAANLTKDEDRDNQGLRPQDGVSTRSSWPTSPSPAKNQGIPR